MAFKTGGYKTKYIEEYGYMKTEYTIYSAVESCSDICSYVMINEETGKEVDICISAEDDTEAVGKYSLIDCLYYLKQRKNKYYEWKERNIIIEEMTPEEVIKYFG